METILDLNKGKILEMKIISDKFDVIYYDEKHNALKIFTNSYSFQKAIKDALNERPNFSTVVLEGKVNSPYLEITNSYKKQQSDNDVRLILIEVA